MKVFTSSIRLTTTRETEEVCITTQVEAIIQEGGVEDGMVLVSTGHTTAAVHLNNSDKDLELDFQDFMSELVPKRSTFRHNKGEYGRNADAHIKSLLVGGNVALPVTKGRVALGQWQDIYFSEFDGPRSRLISVKVIGEKGAAQ
ncbi:MAG TPA: YjbQ family protein [Deltaproteobacteria bacterium]|nr:YjbQ family protein [Deltaproteobacteria bacterium]